MKYSTCWLSSLNLLMTEKCFGLENFLLWFTELHGKIHMARRNQEVTQL